MQRRTFLQVSNALFLSNLARPALAGTSSVTLREFRLDAIPLGALLRRMGRWQQEGYLDPHAVMGFLSAHIDGYGPHGISGHRCAFIGGDYANGVEPRAYRSEKPAYAWWLEAEQAGRRSIIEVFVSDDPIPIIEPGWRDWLADFAPVTAAEWEMALPLYTDRFKLFMDEGIAYPRMNELAFTPNTPVDSLLEARRGILFDRAEVAALLEMAGGDPKQVDVLLFGTMWIENAAGQWVNCDGISEEDYDALLALPLGGQRLTDIVSERAIRSIYIGDELTGSATRLAKLAMTHGIAI